MSPLRRNLDAIAARWPGIAEELAATAPAGDVEAVAARSGAPSARYGGQLLHSLFDPVREADRLVAGSCGADTTAAVVFGFGLGYVCEALLRRSPPLPVLAVEPDPGLLLCALAARPLDVLLGDPRFRLHASANPEGLAAAIEAAGDDLSLARPSVLRLPASAARHGAYFERAQRILVAARDRGRVNVETLERFGPLWVRNLLRNLEAFLSSPGVGEIEGAFDGLPALVLASGPSLDQVLPRIRELAQRCVVVSVDTSLRACLAAGLQPDLLVVIDPQYWNSRHLDGTTSPRTLLVAESATHPRALRLAPRSAFFMSSLFPLGRFVESFGARKGDLGTGGSVATTAWDLARMAGARPIVMAGLDLGYPGRATHFRGAFFEHRFLALANRTEPAEQHAFGYLTGADPFPVRSAGGATVLTDRRMALYASWFERQARRFADVATLTLSGAGVAIPGIEVATIDQVLAMPQRRSDIDERMERLRGIARRGARQPPAWPALRGALVGLLDDLCGAREVAGSAMAAVDRAAARRAGDAESLAEIDRHDRRMLALGARDVVSFLMQPIIDSVMHGPEASDALERTRELYRQIERSAILHERLVRETLDRLPAGALKGASGTADL